MDLDTESLRVLTVEDRFFLEIARKNGLLPDAAARRAVEAVAVRGLRIEAALFHLKLLDEDQLRRVREAMAASQVMRLDSYLGDLALDLGFVSQEQLEQAFEEQRRQRFRVRVGNLLVQGGALNASQHRKLISKVIQRIKREAREAGPLAAPAPLPEPPPEPPPSTERVELPGETERLEDSSEFVTEPLSRPPTERLLESDTEAIPAAEALEQAPLPSSEKVTRIMPPGASIPLQSEERPPLTDLGRGYLQANLESLERASSAEYDPYDERPLPPDGDDGMLIASALRIGFENQDPFARTDELFLEEDLRRASASGDDVDVDAGETENFVLDRVALTATDEKGSFSPQRYLELKRRRSLVIKVGVGVGALVVLLTLVAVGGTLMGNRRRLAQVHELIEQAGGEQSPGDRRSLYLEAGERLAQVGVLGVSEDERRELGARLRWGKLEAEALEHLAMGAPERAVQLLERREGDVAESAREEYDQLLQRARREAKLAEGRRAEERGEYAAAVAAYRDAMNVGDPGGQVRRELEQVRGELTKLMDSAYQQALSSLSEEDEVRFQEAAALIKELYNEDPGSAERLQELAFRRALERGKTHAAAGALQLAREQLQRALELRPRDRTAQEQLQQVEERLRLHEQLQQGQEAERGQRFQEALRCYQRALGQGYASRDERALIRESIERCEAALASQAQHDKAQQLLQDTLTALRESRTSDALSLAGQLAQLDTNGDTSRALLDLAQRAQGMVFVPGGSFLMGTRRDVDGDPLEKPQHQVTLPPYFIGRTEVTNSDYAPFVAAEGERTRPAHWNHRERTQEGVVLSYPPELADHPVVNVTWADARRYAKWRRLALPTEAEWEKAARGDDGRSYPWGEGTRVKAHVDASPDRQRRDWGTAPVGTFADDRSPCGAVDMAGNVNEWTRDRLKPYPDAPRDARIPSDPRRVIRGGAFRYPWWDARCASREGAREDYKSGEVGFRLVLEIPDSLRHLFE